MNRLIAAIAAGLLLGGCGGGDRAGDAGAPAPAPVAVPASQPAPAPVVSNDPVDDLLQAERRAFLAVAPLLTSAAQELIAAHRNQADHLGGGPVIVSLPTVGAIFARSRQVDYGEPVIDRIDRDAASVSHPFTARVLITCTVTTRESGVIESQASMVGWTPAVEPVSDLPLPSAATDAPSLPEGLRPAAALAAEECQRAEAHQEAVVVALRYRFRLETDAWEIDREAR